MNRLTVLSIHLLAILTAPAGAEWRGDIVETDGVRHVLNPEAPLHGEVDVELEELWRVGGDDEDVLFGVIAQLIEGDDGNVYLLDSQLSEIQVFSPDGEHLRTIGRQGEGPGEWQQGFDLYQGSDGVLGVVQIFPGRVINLHPDGTPADNFRLPPVEGGGFQLIYRVRPGPGNIVMSGAFQTREGNSAQQTVYLKSFDLDGNELAHYHDETNPTQFGGMKFKEEVFSDFSRRFAVASDGLVACATDFHEYEIHLWKSDGTKDMVIRRSDYEPVARDDKAKERFQTMWDAITAWNPGSTFEISPTHLTVQNLQFRDDGSLWIMPSTGVWSTPEGVFASYDVYDTHGRFARRVNLLADGDPTEDAIFFVGDRCYIVTDLFSARLANMGGDDAEEIDEEPEPVSVIAYQLPISELTLR